MVRIQTSLTMGNRNLASLACAKVIRPRACGLLKLHGILTNQRQSCGMSNSRRFRIPGSTWFFTVHLARTGERTLTENIDSLRHAYRRTVAEHPVFCDAMVVMPDQIHAVWTLPPGDADFSIRWRKIKARFTRWVGQESGRSQSKECKRGTGLWQRRFCEHQIRDDDDYTAHVAFCLNSPVRCQRQSKSEPKGSAKCCHFGVGEIAA